ncbi:M28 family peptidase [Flavobacterium sp. LC2016-23]|uniref:M28 family peptidase n=1 Tax=Flavobacterium sp. LC2016-23 TaxID=2666330 RepID=UPI0012AFA1C5|nr:M28 family peptidase [Flavobacterium sp. LC2016-23]MRX41956.1 M28 family peptidase [Flavobacterium sp. LC2016-23]
MKTHKKTITFLFFFSILWCQANNPAIVTNVKGIIDKKNHKVSIVYDLSDKEENQIEVWLKITDENGRTYTINKDNAQGDIGFPVATGKNRRIVWTYDNTFDPAKSTIKLVADDRYKIEIEQLLKEVDTVRMIKDLQFINGERNSSTDIAEKHLRSVGEYLKKSFKDNGLKAYYDTFRISNSELNEMSKATTGSNEIVPAGNKKHDVKNVVGSITGQEEEARTFMISAHYDSYPGSLGMDDNGSGVIGLLEVMRVLSQYNFAHNIKFIAFDKEEDGLIGSLSYVFAGGLKKSEKIGGVINFDMIGIASDQPGSQIVPEGFDQLYPEVCKEVAKNQYRGDFVISTSNENSTKLSESFIKSGSRYVKDLKIVSLLVEGNGESTPSLAESDHASFWYNKNPALHIGEGGATRNPNLHTSKDSSGYLKFNYKFMSDIVKTTIVLFMELAEAEHYTEASVRLSR